MPTQAEPKIAKPAEEPKPKFPENRVLKQGELPKK